MVEHIASGCAMDTNTYSVTQDTAWTCTVSDSGGTTLFMDSNASCTDQAIDSSLQDVDDIVSALLGGQCYNSVVNGPMWSS